MSTGLAIFTLVHVAISLAGIAAGFVACGGMRAGQRLDGWILFFLITTALVSITGFGFPFEKFLPSHAVAILSLVILPVAAFAKYARHLAGAFRGIFVVSSVLALYLNFFVLIAQLFLRVPALAALAPTGSEPPFAITQLLGIVFFVWLGRACWKGFDHEAAAAPAV